MKRGLLFFGPDTGYLSVLFLIYLIFTRQYFVAKAILGLHLGFQSAIITLRGREAWYLARPITLRSLVQIQSPQDFYFYRPKGRFFYAFAAGGILQIFPDGKRVPFWRFFMYNKLKRKRRKTGKQGWPHVRREYESSCFCGRK